MSKNKILQSAVNELKSAGIEPEIVKGGKHIRVKWEHNGHSRHMTVPVSSSDYRAAKNNIAGIRRILRADGLLGPKVA